MNTDILISTIRDDPQELQRESLPSFYEIVLVDQIDNMLKPAFRQLLDATLEALPASMIEFVVSIREYWEELYDIIILVVQIRLIRSQGATLAERLYGLQRRGANAGGAPPDVDNYGKPIIGFPSECFAATRYLHLYGSCVAPHCHYVDSYCGDSSKSYEARQRMLDAHGATHLERADDSSRTAQA